MGSKGKRKSRKMPNIKKKKVLKKKKVIKRPPKVFTDSKGKFVKVGGKKVRISANLTNQQIVKVIINELRQKRVIRKKKPRKNAEGKSRASQKRQLLKKLLGEITDKPVAIGTSFLTPRTVVVSTGRVIPQEQNNMLVGRDGQPLPAIRNQGQDRDKKDLLPIEGQPSRLAIEGPVSTKQLDIKPFVGSDGQPFADLSTLQLKEGAFGIFPIETVIDVKKTLDKREKIISKLSKEQKEAEKRAMQAEIKQKELADEKEKNEREKIEQKEREFNDFLLDIPKVKGLHKILVKFINSKRTGNKDLEKIGRDIQRLSREDLWKIVTGNNLIREDVIRAYWRRLKKEESVSISKGNRKLSKSEIDQSFINFIDSFTDKRVDDPDAQVDVRIDDEIPESSPEFGDTEVFKMEGIRRLFQKSDPMPIPGKGTKREQSFEEMKGRFEKEKEEEEAMKKEDISFLQQFEETLRPRTELEGDPKLQKEEPPVLEDDPEEQEGSGINRGGLFSNQIRNIMKKFKKFVGVFAIDQLNLVPVRKEMGFILNTDPSTKKGSHWVAVYIVNNDSIEYYDSFGEDPPRRFMKGIKKLIDKLKPEVYMKFKINRVIDQRSNSGNCGLLAMNFLINRFKGIPFKECSGFSNVMKSERMIRKMRKRLEGFGYI